MYQRSPLGSIPETYLYMAQDLLTFAAFSTFVDICKSFIDPFNCNSIIEVLIRTKECVLAMWKSLEQELTTLCDYNLHLNQLLLQVEKQWQHFVEKFCSWEICNCHYANARGGGGVPRGSKSPRDDH